MSTMFLTHKEVQELTGREYPSAQRKTLDEMGIVYKTNALGKVIVLREHVTEVLNGHRQKITGSNKGIRFDMVR